MRTITGDESGGLSRRGMLARAGALSAGVLAMTAGADPAEADTTAEPYATPEQYGAMGDGVTDDTVAINAALADGSRIVHFAPKTYLINGLVVRPTDVNMVGCGGTVKGMNLAATILKCGSAGAGLKVVGGGGMVQGIMVDGDSVATNCILVGGVSSDDWGAFPAFLDVTARSAAGDNWRIYGSQNGSLIHCTSIGGSRGIVMDYGVGGWLFNRVEVDRPSGVGLEMLNTPGGSLFPNTFVQCIFERRTTNGPIVSIAAANNQVFYHCAFSTQQVPATTAVVSVTSNGLCEFHSPFVTLQPNQAAISVRGMATGTSPQVRLTGAPAMSGFGNAPAYFVDVDNSGWITLDGWIHNSLTGSASFKTPASPDSNIQQIQQAVRTAIRPGATDPVERSLVRGETTPRHIRDVQGTLSWGPGNTAPDTVLSRASVGLLGLQGALSVTKDLVAGRHLNSPQTVAPSASGVVAIDASLGDVWQIALNGTGLTGLTITNALNTQRLTLVIAQGATVASATLPGAADKFLWNGGDTNRPVAPSGPLQSLVVTLIHQDGYWLEVSRASGDLAYDTALQKDFIVSGKLAILHGGLRWYNDTGRALTLRKVRMSVGTAPTGAAVVIDLLRNGTSVFASTAARPRVNPGTNTTSVVMPATTALVANGDYLTLDVVAVGTTKPGNDLYVTVLMA